MRLIDSHCHLDACEFDADRARVLARARHAGIVAQIIPAVTAAAWPKLEQLCADQMDLHPAYGLHPMYLQAHRPAHLADLRAQIERERPVAIGECGLDFYVEGLDAKTQHEYFDAQLRLARAFDLPLIIHARRAVDAVIAALRQIGGLRGVVHSFSGSAQQAEQLHSLGFLLGIGGPVTYPRAQRLRRLAAALPIEQLLLETDSPDQPGADHRGQRNEPAHLIEVLESVAMLRGTSAEVLAEATSANAVRLFRLGET